MKLRFRQGQLLVALGLCLLIACRREHPEAPPPPSVTHAPLAPWTWHPLGGILVIEGEVEQATELRLKGNTLNERRRVELGPVRWELLRPAPGEKAELRDGQDRLLAQWDFDAAPPALALTPPQNKPEPKPVPKPEPKPLPKVEPKALPKPVPPPKPEPKPQPAPRLEPPRTADGRLWPGSGEALNLVRGPRNGQRVCLTFDGGSNAAEATFILDTLRSRGLHTTFFVTGEFIRKFPEVVKRIVREGHEVGNHTRTHPHFAPNGRRDPVWTKARVQEELLSTDQAFFQLTGRPLDPLWRAPFGEHTAEIRGWAEEIGYRHIYWSEGADTLDWATPQQRKLYRTGEAILDRLRDRMARKDGEGLIVLMHLGSEREEHDRPARRLGAFIDRAKAEGWTFVRIGDYLRELGKPAWDYRARTPLLSVESDGRRSAPR